MDVATARARCEPQSKRGWIDLKAGQSFQDTQHCPSQLNFSVGHLNTVQPQGPYPLSIQREWCSFNVGLLYLSLMTNLFLEDGPMPTSEAGSQVFLFFQAKFLLLLTG